MIQYTLFFIYLSIPLLTTRLIVDVQELQEQEVKALPPGNFEFWKFSVTPSTFLERSRRAVTVSSETETGTTKKIEPSTLKNTPEATPENLEPTKINITNEVSTPVFFPYSVPIKETITQLCFAKQHAVLRFPFQIARYFQTFDELQNSIVSLISQVLDLGFSKDDKSAKRNQTLLLFDKFTGDIYKSFTNSKIMIGGIAGRPTKTKIPYLRSNQLISQKAWNKDPVQLEKEVDNMILRIDMDEFIIHGELNTFWEPTHWEEYQTLLIGLVCTSPNACLAGTNDWEIFFRRMFYLSNMFVADFNYFQQAMSTIIQRKMALPIPDMRHLQESIKYFLENNPEIIQKSFQAIRIIFDNQLTYLVEQPQCARDPITGICDIIEIQTILPLITKEDQYNLKSITQLPIWKQGYFSTYWVHLKTNLNYYLDNSKIQLKIESNMYQCLDGSQINGCQLCYFSHQPTKINNPCETTLMRGGNNTELEKICDLENIPEPEDQAILINDNVWAFSDRTPGTIIETCGNKKVVTQLEKTGLIKFNPSCKYDLINTPVAIQPSFRQTIVENIALEILKKVIPQTGHVTSHLQEYLYYYLVPGAGTVLIVILAIIFILIRHFRKRWLLRNRAEDVPLIFLREPKNESLPRSRRMISQTPRRSQRAIQWIAPPVNQIDRGIRFQ